MAATLLGRGHYAVNNHYRPPDQAGNHSLMRESHFWQLMTDEFGSANAQIIATSIVLPGLDQTSTQALDAGVDPAQIWTAVCDQHEIPAERRLGRDIKPKDTGNL